MIRIDQRTPIGGAVNPARGRAAGATAFALDKGRSARPQETAHAGATVALGGLLGLQAEEEAGQRRRRRARHGSELLDGLDKVKAALLSGRLGRAELERLAAMLAARSESSDDPQLEEIVAQIELRAAVELAKLGR